MYVRFVNQLNTGTNARNNCVPASLESGASALGVNVTTQALHDAEYGASYLGPTSPTRYTDDGSDTLTRDGLHLSAVSGDESALVARVHAELRAGHPVLMAIPSQWGNFSIPVSVRRTQRNPDGSWLPTHFVLMYEEVSGGLAAMNPWGAFRHVNTDGNWAKLLVLGTVWILSKEGAKVLDISQTEGFFKDNGNGTWTCTKTGKTIDGGMLNVYRQLGGPGLQLAGLTMLGLPLTDILYGTGWGVQVYERGAIVWDPKRQYDSPPGVQGDYYLAHVEKGKVLDFLAADLKAQLDAAQTQEQADQKQIDTLNAEVAALKNNPPHDAMGDAIRAVFAQAKKEGL